MVKPSEIRHASQGGETSGRSQKGAGTDGMTKRRPLLIVTRKLPDFVETRMCELFDTRLNMTDKPMSQQDLADAMRVADVIVPTVTDRSDAGLIAQAGESMKLIANFGNGVDNI